MIDFLIITGIVCFLIASLWIVLVPDSGINAFLLCCFVGPFGFCFMLCASYVMENNNLKKFTEKLEPCPKVYRYALSSFSGLKNSLSKNEQSALNPCNTIEKDALIVKQMYESSKTLEPVKGIQKTINPRTFYYDPTIEISNDIKDEKGNIVTKKGTKINPLQYNEISKNFIFFDATDTKQLEWAKQQTNSIWVLINGDIKALSNEYNKPVFFDQNGELIKKLGITQIPAIVSRSNEHIKIEEVEAL